MWRNHKKFPNLPHIGEKVPPLLCGFVDRSSWAVLLGEETPLKEEGCISLEACEGDVRPVDDAGGVRSLQG